MSRKNLEKLLSENIPDIHDKELWIFGAGNTAALYYNGLLRLEKEGIFITGYTDNNKSKWNTVFNGKLVVSPDSLLHRKNDICILICSVQSKVVNSIKQQLLSMGFNNYYHIDDVIFKLHKDKVLQVYDLLADDDSKDIYEVLLKERMQCANALLPVDEHEQYFALNPFMINNPGEVFVDCGAYVGDTIEKYIWQRDGVFKKIIGFEPDEINFKAMQRRVERLKQEWALGYNSIQIYNKGVADKNKSGQIERYELNHGLGSRIVDNPTKVSSDSFIVALDVFMKDEYSFLKADIESWEYNLLKGATKGIKSSKPLLAICIYHNAVDFYEIPLLVHEIVPEYRLAIRHHSYTLAETVLYAWIL